MSAANFPVTLEQVFFTRSVVIAVKDHKPEEAPVPGPENKINVAKLSGEQGLYEVVMRSLMNQDGSAAFPYVIDMEVVGVFRVEQNLSDDEALRAVTITGHSVCYGAIREAVSWLTGRQPYGTMMLGLSVLPSKPADAEPQKK